MMTLNATFIRRSVQVLLHAWSFFYLVRLYFLGFSDRLGGDPVETIIHTTGTTAFILLLVTLCITPMTQWIRATRSSLGRGGWMRLRRPVGLWSFVYAINHLVCYTLFELQLNWLQLWEDLTQRWYLIFGALALGILSALSATSLPYLMRRMGRRWKQLHNTIYLAVILVWLHFALSLKADWVEPSLYATAIALLFLLRVDKFLPKIAKWRAYALGIRRRLAKN